MSIVKSYIGNTQKEAFDKVRADLGEEAVIINTRLIRKKGLKNLFKKPLVEVTAVVDNVTGHTTAIGRRRVDDPVAGYQQQKAAQSVDYQNANIKNEKLEKIERQMMQLSELVSKVYRKIDVTDESKLLDDDLHYLFSTFIKNDIAEEFAYDIIDRVRKKRDEFPDRTIEEIACEIIKKDLGKAEPVRRRKGKKNIMLFVGPTGVGKTTTIAKIASIYALGSKAKVALITEDTYRIGAVEQLKIYADILGINLDVIYNPEEITQKLESGCDMYLIDTAGKGPKDENYHQNMIKLIEAANPTEIFLVISATTAYENAAMILENYGFLQDYRLIFTKYDEYGKPGFIYNIKRLSGRPISYITDGQNVAEDIYVADTQKIAKSLCER